MQVFFKEQVMIMIVSVIVIAMIVTVMVVTVMVVTVMVVVVRTLAGASTEVRRTDETRAQDVGVGVALLIL